MFNRQLMATVFRAPPSDTGATYDDIDDEVDLELDPDLEDQDDELEVDDLVDPDPQPEPPRRTRGENRVAEATRIAAEAKAETAALKAQLEQMSAQPVNPNATREAAEERQRRLAAMSESQRTDFLLTEQRNQFEARFAQVEFSTKDSADAAAFRSLCATNPQAAKMAADVETELANLRKQGLTSPRETILKYLIGDRIMAGAPKARQRQAAAAAPGTARNAARPSGGRSDVQTGDRRNLSEVEARRKRLEGMKF
jgi:hypothetical protein